MRFAIDCLPVHTREAMLDGVRQNRIIVGAYTDRNGGICPMLAAHRHGGRTSLASFAKAWDRYTGARSRTRHADDRELRTLTAMLESSLTRDQLSDTDTLAEAVAEMKAAKGRRREEKVLEERADTGERDRTNELRSRPGWSWLRVFRRFDEYEAALARAHEAEAERAEELERELV